MTATVTTPEQLQQAISDGAYDILIDEPLYFEREAQCVVCDEATRSPSFGIGLTIRGHGGNWTPSVLHRLFDGGQPLLRIGLATNEGAPAAPVHYELRMRGLTFADDRHRRGPGLRVGYSQQSIFEDLRFQGFVDEPAYLHSNGSEFRFLQFLWNAAPATFDGIANCTFERIVTNAAWRTEYDKGFICKAGPREGANAVTFRNLHNEGVRNTVTGFRSGVLYAAGYHLAAHVRFEDCYAGAVRIDRDGMSWEASSEMFINGYGFHPIGQRWTGVKG